MKRLDNAEVPLPFYVYYFPFTEKGYCYSIVTCLSLVQSRIDDLPFLNEKVTKSPKLGAFGW